MPQLELLFASPSRTVFGLPRQHPVFSAHERTRPRGKPEEDLAAARHLENRCQRAVENIAIAIWCATTEQSGGTRQWVVKDLCWCWLL